MPTRSAGSTDSHVSERILSQFLAEFDGIDELRGVLVLGATNRLDILDTAVLRPGRFDDIVEMMMPSQEDREAIFAIHLRRKPLAEDINCQELAGQTEGFSGADIAAVARKAAMTAVRRAVKDIEQTEAGEPEIIIRRRDMEGALEEVRRGMG